MKTFDGMALDAIHLFKARHPSPAIGGTEQAIIEGHAVTIAETLAVGDEERRFSIRMKQGVIQYDGIYALVEGGTKMRSMPV